MALVACARSGEWASLPAQWPAFGETADRPFGSFVKISDPHARAYVSRDIAVGTTMDELRWAFRNPQLRFWLNGVNSQVFIFNFRMHSLTLASTGPVVITVSINGHKLDQIRCANQGDYHFERPVPAAWLRADGPTIVDLTPDRVWVSPSDGGALSFLIRQAGFQRQ